MWVRNKLKLSSTSGATASSSSSSQLMMKSNWTALHQAAKKGDVDRAKRLLADGSADPNASTTEPFDNLPEATTALHVAAQFGHLSIVQLLFDSGKRVNVNAVDDHGYQVKICFFVLVAQHFCSFIAGGPLLIVRLCEASPMSLKFSRSMAATSTCKCATLATRRLLLRRSSIM